MKTEEFDFKLDESLIAQYPLEDRASSNLMVVDISKNQFKHEKFHNITKYLKRGDVLVLNDTKVMPARLFGIKQETNAHVELLILKLLPNDEIECIVSNAKAIKLGTKISFNGGELVAECISVLEEGIRIFKVYYEGIFLELLNKIGTMPLPSYIKKELKDQDKYQTIYAKELGSAASPTAGLHFTNDLLKQIKDKGVIITNITLHVGLGTFRPVHVEDIEKHIMHKEHYYMSFESAEILNSAKKENRRIIAVGTTTVRTLETIYNKYNEFKSSAGDTNIFIYPGYNIKSIDGLITNFHLPKSTLMMLISAFANKDLIMKCYEEAITKKYRFFSFGDSMFLIKKIV